MKLLLALCALLLMLPATVTAADEVRALWVTRYDYATADDVRAIVKGAAELGINRILFQVRGNASVFYPSTVEPWSERLGGKDPGFDPLALVVAEAKQRGIKVEAWINVLPLWKGRGQPKDPRHPFRRHPDWVVVGSDGQPQRQTEHYLCANPARADVRAHVAKIAAEIAKGYEVDAVHLDYVRYVLDLERKLDFSHDPVSLKRFGRDPVKHPEAWRAFKATQITDTVAAIRTAIHSARANCRLTAAVFPTRESRAKVHQDVERWVQRGLVDALYPMTYADDDAEYERRLKESLPLGGETVAVHPGIAVRRHKDPAQTLRHIEAARARGAKGFALFCYSAFYASADHDELLETDAGLRGRRVQALRKLLRAKD